MREAVLRGTDDSALPPTNAYLYDLQTEFAGRRKTLDVGCAKE